MSVKDDELNKAIGFDPVKWIERLRDVNALSQFTPPQRAIIERRLSELQTELAS
jgi:hypothetical protein